MSLFLRLLGSENKEIALKKSCTYFRRGDSDPFRFEVPSDSFSSIPGKPFAYWVSSAVRDTFRKFPRFESDGRVVKQGLATADDFRFVRAWWEVEANHENWPGFAKGGAFSPFYADIHLVVNWSKEGEEIKNNLNESGGVRSNVWMLKDTAANFFRKPGLTWPSRAKRFAPQALPMNCLFSQRGYLAYFPEGDQDVALGIFNSVAFDYLFKTTLGRFGYPEFLVGILQLMPWAKVDDALASRFSSLALRGWSLMRKLKSIEETSHAFLLPAILLDRNNDYDPRGVEAELAKIQSEIDGLAFDIYGFSDFDRDAALFQIANDSDIEGDQEPDETDEYSVEAVAPPVDALFSWSVGVSFGRFDHRLATHERQAPPDPGPFDPLPTQSPGMLPHAAQAFHIHPGILVDDHGHQHDLARLVEEVLGRVQVAVPDDVRYWLRRDFFSFHLQRYSKSRRKAPIYWPLSTASGSYTLWVYYPSLTNQTLYTAINDFVEPKLKQVSSDVSALRNKASARSRDDERQFEVLQAFELELIELRDTLLKLAPNYKPVHDDGVQISAAPLWPLFRHKLWQKMLKDTWAKLEKGEYDWAHLAMSYWPDRVREKCKADKSLAIAHGLEHLYVEPEAQPKKTRVRKKAGGDE